MPADGSISLQQVIQPHV